MSVNAVSAAFSYAAVTDNEKLLGIGDQRENIYEKNTLYSGDI